MNCVASISSVMYANKPQEWSPVPIPISMVVSLWVSQFTSLFKEGYSPLKALHSSHFIAVN